MSVFEVRIEGDARIVVSGELDMATAPLLTRAVESLGQSTDARRVVIDLAGVSFIDSSGISALVLGHATLQAAGAVLALGSMSGQVESVLQMTGVHAQFVHDGQSGLAR